MEIHTGVLFEKTLKGLQRAGRITGIFIRVSHGVSNEKKPFHRWPKGEHHLTVFHFTLAAFSVVCIVVLRVNSVEKLTIQ